jgi:hypothetical protein
MLIAREKKSSNIAEYILYMYQLEDAMRAMQMDIELIEENIVNGFSVPVAQRAEIKEWYLQLILAMKNEGIEKSGHLAYLREQVSELASLNKAVLTEARDKEYLDSFARALPSLTSIVQKSNGSVANEVDAAFTLLYGVMVLRMKKEAIGEDTECAAANVAHFVRKLAIKYRDIWKDEQPKE